jgi:hypothetical protein
VCAADPKIANDYQHKKQAVVVDEVVSNGGVMRHPPDKYFRQPVVQAAIKEGLGL